MPGNYIISGSHKDTGLNRPTSLSKPLKAFKITIMGWDGFRSIDVAETPGKAKAQLFYAAYEAGLEIPFVDFRAKRAPEFDYLATKPGNLLSTEVTTL